MAKKVINTVLNLKDQFSSKFAQVGKHTKQQSKQMKLLGNHMKSFRGSATNSLTSVAKSAGAVAVAFVGVNAAFDAVRDGVQFVKDYQSSLANLQAATGATAAETAVLKKDITDLYKQNMGESWSDLASAMTLAKQVTGQVGQELKQTTGLAVTYRDTFGEDMAGSIKTVDTLMKNFGISSEQAYNLLAQGAQKGLNKSGELLDTANEYSVYFSKLGFSADQMFDYFSAGIEAGAFNLDKVGDGIKEFGIRTKDGSKASMEAYKTIGLNGAKMTKQFAAGGDIAQKAFLDTVKAINEITDPVKKNEAAVQLFGTQAEDLEDKVVKAYGNVKSQFDMTKNTMGEINKIKYSNATDAFKGIGRMVETNVLIPIADRVLPKLSEFGQWFSDQSPKIEAAISQAFTTGTTILNGFKDAIGWTKENADWLIPVIGGLTTAIAAQKVIGIVTGLYKTWTTVTKGMTIAQIALNFATKASPLGILATVIGLVVAAGIYLWKNWDTVKAKGQALWTSISSIWTNIKGFITNTVTGIGDWLNSFPLGQGLITGVKDAVAGIKTVFNGIVSFITNIFKGNWSGAWDSIVSTFSDTFALIAKYAKAPLNTVINLVNNMIDLINGLSIDIPDWVPKFGGKTFGLDIPHIPNFGLGTPYFKGGLARINERNGGEIVNLPNGSQVIPADKSEKMINNSRGETIVNININNLYGEEEQVNRTMDIVVARLKLALEN